MAGGEHMTCPRLGMLFGGCKFSPRYDVGAPKIDGDLRGNAGDVVALVETSKPKTYVRDVCETCGKTIERGQGAREGQEPSARAA